MLPGPAGPAGPPRVVVPSGADDRYVLAIPLPPGMAAADDRRRPSRWSAASSSSARRPAGRTSRSRSLATSAFAFSAQVAARMRDGRVVPGRRRGPPDDAARRPGHEHGHRRRVRPVMEAGLGLPRHRRPIRSSTRTRPSAARSAGATSRCRWCRAGPAPTTAWPRTASCPDARPGARAPHAWLAIGSERVSTLDLFGRELVLLTAGDGAAWRAACEEVAAGVARDPDPRARGRDGGCATPTGRSPRPTAWTTVGPYSSGRTGSSRGEPKRPRNHAAAVLRTVIDEILGRRPAAGEREEAA